ncbi:MAG: hypothetical protein KJZ65_14300 [Phycisphaerales bacterium]|nr:hypothetical protein [Phycisphaerales bacterium]
MMHVIDGSEGAVISGRHPEAVRLLLDATGGDEVRVCAPLDAWFGPGMDERAARRLLPLPRGTPIGRSATRSETDRVHAWSRSTAPWAMRAAPGIDLEATLLEGPSRISRGVRRAARRFSRFDRVRLLDAADADDWIRAGLPRERLCVQLPDVNRVRSNVGRLADRFGLPHERASLRALLDAGDDEFLVFPVASPWSGLDAHRFVFLLGMLRINATPATAIVPASAWRLVGARVFREQSRLGTRVCVIEGPMTPWLSAADAAFLDSERPRETLLPYRPRGALRALIAAAEALGVPVAVAPGSLLEAEPRRSPSVADELRPLLRIAERWSRGRTSSDSGSPAASCERAHSGA